MKIAVDCRYLEKSGIGRVLEGILENLDYGKNEFVLIGKENELKRFSGAEIIACESDPFSVKGLFDFPKTINKTCDALIEPNFIIPFGVKIPVVSIIHDLIFLDLKYMNKGLTDRFAKRFLIKRCVKKSAKISCVSEFTLSRCERYFPKFKDKFFVSYNGISKSILNYRKPNGLKKDEKTIVYVGNVKPHKGLKTLFDAYKLLPKGYTLKIIGEKDNFITGLNCQGLFDDGVVFTGKLKDDFLLDEIAAAGLLVQPSEYEGFGLPPLEALYLKTKPIVSDIEVFKEIYGNLPVDFFKTGDGNDLKNAILNADLKVEDVKEKIENKYNYKNCSETIVNQTVNAVHGVMSAKNVKE